jgi:hypothetical protein
MPAKRSLKCLTVRQPWAWAICVGAKDIENRSWTTRHRGPIAIVASAKKGRVNAMLREASPRTPNTALFTFGAVIGLVDLVTVEEMNQGLESNRWASGPWCWRLANARLLPSPIPCRPKLNVYSADDAMAEGVVAQASRASAGPIDRDGTEWLEIMEEYDTPSFLAHLESYELLERWADLHRVSAAALAEEPEQPLLLYCCGRARLGLGEPALSIPFFSMALEIDPDDAGSLFMRGRAYEALGKADWAKEDYDRAYELTPEIESFLRDNMAVDNNDEASGPRG